MIYPMYAMVLLTFLIAVCLLANRVRDIRGGRIKIKYFRTLSGEGDPSEGHQKAARQFINLFEVPVLFYAGCLTAMITQMTGTTAVALAWGFVAARALQAAIHLTYNNVKHRMVAYFTGFGCVLALWTLIAISAA